MYSDVQTHLQVHDHRHVVVFPHVRRQPRRQIQSLRPAGASERRTRRQRLSTHATSCTSNESVNVGIDRW